MAGEQRRARRVDWTMRRLAGALILGLASLLACVDAVALPHAADVSPRAHAAPRPASTATIRTPATLARAGAGTGTSSGRLPAGARGAVSAALGHDDPAYSVVGMRAGNAVQRLSMSFSRVGVRLSSGATDVRLALEAYGRGSTLRRVAPVAPRARANRVDYRHAGIDEWYANGPLGLEQGFDVGSRPRGGDGTLTLSLALSGDVHARLQAGGVLLSGPNDTLRYAGLRATDAHGHTLRSWLELARGRLLIRVDDRGATYPLRIDPFLQQAELSAEHGAEGDELGWSVAVSENTIVAGAPFHKVGTHERQGAVYVFTKPASGWVNATQTAELTASDGEEGDRLGSSVAISGDTIVAGAPFHKVEANTEQGAVYVFTKPASGWANAIQTAKLTAAEGEDGQGLGWSVAASGETVVAGAPGTEEFIENQPGAAYVFTKPATGWAHATQTAELTAAEGRDEAAFGTSVALSENTIAVGAVNAGEHEEGAAYVYTKPVSGWATATQTAELIASNGAPGDELGRSVATSGETVVAGAPRHKVVENARQGAVYVYAMPATGWVNAPQTAVLTASDGLAEDSLGGSVAISGDTIVAGAIGHPAHPGAGEGAELEAGAAYVFAEPASGWTNASQSGELDATEGIRGSLLGFSVAIDGGTVAAGAPGRTLGANGHQGLVYTFVNPPPRISIAAPLSDVTYTQGENVAVAYSCTASLPATLESCTGPVANGAPLDTGTPGPHTFTVSARDSDGEEASQTVAYTVVAATSPASEKPAEIPPPGGKSPPPPTHPEEEPVYAQREIATPISGTATIRLQGTKRFVPLTSVESIRNGSEIDAIHGRVRITVATRVPGQTRTAEIYEGRVIVYQDKSGLTHFKLSLPLEGCASASRATSTSAHLARHRQGRTRRQIWTSTPDTGFETDGKYIEGGSGEPIWLTVDECARSYVKVTQGSVYVHDLVRRRSLVLRAGHTYIAAPGSRRRR